MYPKPRPRKPGEKIGPSSGRLCPKGSGPHSAAKQGRSFRVPALNHPVSICAHGGQGHGLQQNRAVLFVWLLLTAFLSSKLCPSAPGSKKGPSNARVCPKGSGPHSTAKQGCSFRVPALNHPGSMCAQGGQGHILQQNRAVLTVSRIYDTRKLRR